MRRTPARLLTAAVWLWLAHAGAAGALPPPPAAGGTPSRDQPAPVAARLPAVVLKGRVIARDRSPAALVEVDGRLQFLTRGSVLAGPGSTTLRVMEMSASEIRILVSPPNETIVLR
jgi:hypothetical protein